MPLRKQLQTLFDDMIKIFAIRTCRSRTHVVHGKMSKIPTIITYNLASSTTKSSSLSSTSKLSTPPWVEGIVVAGTDPMDTGAEDTKIVGIEPVDIKHVLAHISYSLRYSLNRYMMHLQASVNTKFIV